MIDRMIRPMRAGDVPQVVAVHLEAFPGFFLSFLGPAFLRQFYAAIVADPSAIHYVCQDGDRILGLVVGTAQPGGFYRRLLRRRGWRFGLASVGPALRRPAIVPRLLRAVRMPQHAAAVRAMGTLMSLAVAPPARGRGIGRALVGAFLDEAGRRGLQQVNLTTDRLDHDAINRFYRKLGFTVARVYVTPEGREMNEYTIDVYLLKK